VVVCPELHERGNNSPDLRGPSVPHKPEDSQRVRRFSGSGDAVVVCVGSANNVKSTRGRSYTKVPDETLELCDEADYGHSFANVVYGRHVH
jgi:hypothetical protein